LGQRDLGVSLTDDGDRVGRGRSGGKVGGAGSRANRAVQRSKLAGIHPARAQVDDGGRTTRPPGGPLHGAIPGEAEVDVAGVRVGAGVGCPSPLRGILAPHLLAPNDVADAEPAGIRVAKAATPGWVRGSQDTCASYGVMTSRATGSVVTGGAATTGPSADPTADPRAGANASACAAGTRPVADRAQTSAVPLIRTRRVCTDIMGQLPGVGESR